MFNRSAETNLHLCLTLALPLNALCRTLRKRECIVLQLIYHKFIFRMMVMCGGSFVFRFDHAEAAFSLTLFANVCAPWRARWMAILLVVCLGSGRDAILSSFSRNQQRSIHRLIWTLYTALYFLHFIRKKSYKKIVRWHFTWHLKAGDWITNQMAFLRSSSIIFWWCASSNAKQKPK